MTFVPVCKASEISSQKPKCYIVESVKILIVRDSEDQIWAFDSICTHEDKSLENAKWNPESTHLTCPFHAAVFLISQGGLAISPPAILPLKIYKNIIQNQNSERILYVDLDS